MLCGNRQQVFIKTEGDTMNMNNKELYPGLEAQLRTYHLDVEDFEKKGLKRLAELEKPYGQGTFLNLIFRILKKLGIYDQPKHFKKKLAQRVEKGIKEIEDRIKQCHQIQEKVFKLSQDHENMKNNYILEKEKFMALLEAYSHQLSQEKDIQEKQKMEREVETARNMVDKISELIVTHQNYSKQYLNEFEKFGILEQNSKKIKLGLEKTKVDLETQISIDLFSYYKFQKEANRMMTDVERFISDIKHKESRALEFIASIPTAYKKPFSTDYSNMHQKQREELQAEFKKEDV